ncbi:MAG: hypothetical protein EP343_09595 [Deltaproteobacteria bacterium]|nr:MAG: hypothetical protein EP343_09595 [Deltaproteobacteria bacterium]
MKPNYVLSVFSVVLLGVAGFLLFPSLFPLGSSNSRRSFAERPTKRASKDKKPILQQLKFVTYNVLADRHFQQQRTQGLIRILKASNADVIALQEAAGWFLIPLLQTSWVKKHYHMSRYRGRPVAPGGQFLLSKYPIARTFWDILPGPQRRAALFAELKVNGRSLAVATTHMESPLEDGPIRARQLDRMFQLLKKYDDAVLLGDFNFGDGEQPDTQHLDSSYTDVWTLLMKGKPGYTWDIPGNPLAKVGSFKGERNRRLDRILVRSKRWRATSVRRLGMKAIGQGKWYGSPLYQTGNKAIDEAHRNGLMMKIFPSDHYGLVGTLSWK